MKKLARVAIFYDGFVCVCAAPNIGPGDKVSPMPRNTKDTGNHGGKRADKREPDPRERRKLAVMKHSVTVLGSWHPMRRGKVAGAIPRSSDPRGLRGMP